jgi:DNA/RNA endonuclease G (NUC1)/V8-like Glu-specific endopeptidase
MNDRASQVAAFARSLFLQPGTNESLEAFTPAKKEGYLESSGASEEQVDTALGGLDAALRFDQLTDVQAEGLEAIIFADRCPTLALSDGKITDPPKGEWKRLTKDNEWLPEFGNAAGRLDCDSIPAAYAGSGFLVGPDLVMTNRHVARLFTEGLGEREALRFLYPTELDYRKEEFAPTRREPVSVDKVLLIHPYWDVALLRLTPASGRTPVTLSHEAPAALAGRPVAIIGYPYFKFAGRDYDPKVVTSNFGNFPGYKRLQPGWLTERREYADARNVWPRVLALGHNASTMGGNSGSLVVDLDARHVLGVHFGGQAFDTNWAVPSWELYRDPRFQQLGVRFTSDGKDARPDPMVEKAWAAIARSSSVAVPENIASAPQGTTTALAVRPQGSTALAVVPERQAALDAAAGTAVINLQLPIEISVRVLAPVTAPARGAAPAAPVVSATTGATESLEAINFDDDYSDRTGYDPDFLGETVPLPTLTDAAMKQVSRDRTREAEDNHLLHYHHFSLVMNKVRRLAFFTACNTTRDPKLFGEKSRKDLSASEPWRIDPRIPVTHQITTSEFYKGTEFDRGHIVRREDAYWGGDEDEQEFSNFDSFHYTNCSPQHAAYNRSNKKGLWGLLENQIAAQSKAKDLKISLFAGPILAARDRVLWNVRVPNEFWKVVLSVDDATGKLGAWAFRLSQKKLVAAVEEEVFDPGAFTAQQVPIAKLHELTEVRFADVVLAADTFAGKSPEEAIEVG